MRAAAPRVVGGALLLLAFLAAGRWAVAETLTRHDEVAPGSELVVEIRVRAHAQAEADEAQLAEALVSLCQVEVRASVVEGSFAATGVHHYRFTLAPSLDEADRRQLRGCLQDMRIDGVLAHVESTTERR